MLSPREIGLMLLASLATVAIGAGYQFTRPAEKPCSWHDVVLLPADSEARAKLIDAVALDVTREANKCRGGMLHCRLVETRLSAD